MTRFSTGAHNRTLSDGTYSYTYDAEGNLSRRTRNADGSYRDFQWDHRNRLIAVIDYDAAGTEQQRIVYTYDLFDRLIKRSYDDDGSQGPNSPVDTYWAGYVGYEATLEFDGSLEPVLVQRELDNRVIGVK